jgi:hypothetical protein
VISSWSLFANGEPWDLLNGGAITYYGARIFQTNRAFLTEGGPIELGCVFLGTLGPADQQWLTS